MVLDTGYNSLFNNSRLFIPKCGSIVYGILPIPLYSIVLWTPSFKSFEQRESIPRLIAPALIPITIPLDVFIVSFKLYFSKNVFCFWFILVLTYHVLISG